MGNMTVSGLWFYYYIIWRMAPDDFKIEGILW